jgi:hypothetical protein
LIFLPENNTKVSIPVCVWGVEIMIHEFLTFRMGGSEWKASYSVALSQGKESLVPTAEILGWAPQPL